MKKKKIIISIIIIILIIIIGIIIVNNNPKDNNYNNIPKKDIVDKIEDINKEPSQNKDENKNEEIDDSQDKQDSQESQDYQDTEENNQNSNSSSQTNKPNSNQQEYNKNETTNKTESTTKPATKPDNSNNNESNKEENETIPDIPEENSQEKINNEYRNQIQEKYNVTIKYGKEFTYKPNGKTPNYLTDEQTTYNILKGLDTSLSQYPSGFFKEMKQADMPVTFYLIESISDNSFAGLTDKNLFYDIKITITNATFLTRTIHHEIMHYIEAYLEIKLYPNNGFTDWTKYNGDDFTYGNFDTSKVYGLNNKYNANFVNNYAQTNRAEDIASTFEDMMSRSYKPVGLYDLSSPVYNKATIINRLLVENYECVKENTTYQWNRFLK